ncbi:MAG TPA: helix-turn-helix transcriptional regulator [Streptosporangiaceae bacterium]|nr:helix-turn-helix transcriptional regulator [Streptosporangiaceae bacterium]
MSIQAGSGPPVGDLGRVEGGSTVLRVMVGGQLRRFREAAQVTPDEAAYAIRASRSKISRMENGRVGFKTRDVGDLLTLYRVNDRTRAEVMALAQRASVPGWWAQYSDIVADWFEAYLGMEAAASLIRSFEGQFVHGLFQTEAYARAVTMLGYRAAPAEEIDRRVSMRMKRQEQVGRPGAPHVWSVLDEAVLRRPVGGPEAMRAQLDRLIEAARLPDVTIQVVPFGRGGHAAGGGSFTVLRFAEPDVPDVVYIEQLTSALYLEKRDDVEHYLEVMNVLGAQALSPAATERLIRQIIRET